MTIAAGAAVFALGPALGRSPLAHGQAVRPAVLYSLPDHYLTNYSTRKAPCRAQALNYPTWTSWNSYDEGQIGSRWAIYASKSSLCSLAGKTAKSLLNSNDLPFSDGTSIVLINWQGYAISVGQGS